jgi:hypothetical protein
MQTIQTRTNTLEMLLTPKTWAFEENPARMIGKCFAGERERRNLSITEIVSLTDGRMALEIEYGNMSRQATLNNYLQYADILGVSLQEILSPDHLQESANHQKQKPRNLFQERLASISEEHMLKQVEEAIKHLQAQDKPILLSNISKRIGIPAKYLMQHYPRVNALLTTWQHLRRYDRAAFDPQREEELLLQMEQAIKTLELQGKSITHWYWIT